MATRIGVLAEDFIASQWSGVPQFVKDGVAANQPADTFRITARNTSTGQTKNHPYTYPTKTHNGYKAPAYSDIFFNKVLIEPLVLNLGIVASDKEVAILLSNLFLVEERQLVSISGVDTEGITISGVPTPKTLLPLETIEYIITITPEGPPTINATFTFHFTDTQHNQTVIITGSRIVVYPYQFRPGMVETLEWNTSILRSRNGTEQRIRNRIAPRRQLNTTSFTGSNEFIRAGNLVYGWRGRTWALPIYNELTNLSADVVEQSLLIPVDTRYGSFDVGGLALIYRNPRYFDVVQIASFTDNDITSTQGLFNSYTTSDFVVPIQSARITSNPVRDSSGHNGTISINWEILTGTDSPVAGNPPTQWKNLDVLLDNVFEILTPSDNDRITYNQRVDIIDYTTGNVEFFSPELYMNTTRTIRFIIEGLDNIWDFKSWLRRRSGRLSPFWLPTFEMDMIAQNNGVMGNSLLTPDYDYNTQAFEKVNAIIFLKSGSFLLRTITGSDTSSSGLTEIFFETPLSVTKEDISRISLMSIYRFDTDRVQMRWLQDNKITCDILVREISPK